MPLLQAVPIVEQFLLVQLSPRLNQTALSRRERARDHVDGVNADNRDLFLPVRMKMGDVMLPARFGEHADDDSEKATEFRHL